MNAFIQKITSTTSGIASTILRIPVGIILMAHGAQKLFGAFGGYGDCIHYVDGHRYCAYF